MGPSGRGLHNAAPVVACGAIMVTVVGGFVVKRRAESSPGDGFMKKASYTQYMGEVDNWLHRGRRLLLQSCLSLALPKRPEEGDKKLQVLEVGAGSGRNISVLSRFGEVDAIEVEPLGIESLRKNAAVRQLYTSRVPFQLDRKYDVICAMDFLEHVEDDAAVFQWMVDHLVEGGTLFITVPAFQFLFSSHDVALEHYRRYRVGQLIALNHSSLAVEKKGYFNFLLFPLVVVLRLLGKLLASSSAGKSQKKQSSSVHPMLDKLFFGVLKAEVSLLRRLPLYPFGLTAYALFRK